MEFKPFDKIARLSRECCITEKIDGTNGCVIIEPVVEGDIDEGDWPAIVVRDNALYRVGAASRSQLISPAALSKNKSSDNHGFAAWVYENRNELVNLGSGYHYGEWWGSGIQRNYGLKEKRFSLFNTHRWSDPTTRPACCHVVPVLYQGVFSCAAVDECIIGLHLLGSVASKGFTKPEGVVIYHSAAKVYFKKTLEKDEQPKGA